MNNERLFKTNPIKPNFKPFTYKKNQFAPKVKQF